MMREAQVEALSEQGRQEAEAPAPVRSVKAKAEEDRDRVFARVLPVAQRELDRFFSEQRGRVVAALQEQLPASKAARRTFIKADPPWWDSEREDRELRATVRSIYVSVGRESLQVAADALGRFLYRGAIEPIVTDLLTRGGRRIKDINDRTLQSLTAELAEGTRRGYSINQLIDGVPEEGYRGVTGVTLENGTPVFGDARAEVIARTETMLSYNRASVRGYEALGVERFLAYDGDYDEVCAERDGQVFSAEEAVDIEDHPNGTLVFSPLVDKAWHPEPTVVNITNNIPESPAPVVNVAPPDVHVSSPVTVEPAQVNVTTPPVKVDVAQPQVNVTTPETIVNVPTPVINVTTPPVNVEAPVVKVSGSAKAATEMRITELPTRVTRRTVKRDKSGAITETTEVETDG
jgi:hypothetical protein